jgi:alpha-beta hydrolase superfamily lysophospholipase
MKVETFEVRSNGLKIYGNIHFPKDCPAPLIICSHGLFSSKESSKFIALTNSLAARGFVSVRYDHRGCGISEGSIQETTVSDRLQDLYTVCNRMKRHPAVDGALGLMGSSMGGYITLLAARQLETRAIAIWSTPFTISRKKKIESDGSYPALNDAFYEDLNRHQLQGPLGGGSAVLVVHGQNDELVPVWHATNIYGALNAPKVLELMPGADHSFSDETDRQAATGRTAQFFQTMLL